MHNPATPLIVPPTIAPTCEVPELDGGDRVGISGMGELEAGAGKVDVVDLDELDELGNISRLS